MVMPKMIAGRRGWVSPVLVSVVFALLCQTLAATETPIPVELAQQPSRNRRPAARLESEADPTRPESRPPVRPRPTPVAPGGTVPETTPPGEAREPAPLRTARLDTSSNFQSRFPRLSSIPYMVGDTSAGGCGVLRIGGGVPAANIAHPTFACSRLNIAENNSPLVRDRVTASYRHFHNASAIDIFGDFPLGGRNELPIDRWTFGLERRCTENCSLEFRIPVNTELSSNLFFSQTSQGGGPVSVSLPINDVRTELGNLAVLLKRSLYTGDELLVSGGLALNMPTAPDVKLTGRINDQNFAIRDPQNPGNVLLQTPVIYNLDAVVRNETFNLSPFLGTMYAPTNHWFAQGFVQWDIPLNTSTGSILSDVSLPAVGFTPPPVIESAELAQQQLLRLNVGAGLWLRRNECARFVQALAIMFELHYTTTLQDAELLGGPNGFEVIPGFGGIFEPTTVQVGNVANRTDSLSLAVGVPLTVGLTTITSGFIVPLRDVPDRGFDFEYNLAINRQF